MPFIEANGVKLHYEEFGTGAETLCFTHSLLYNLNQYRPQYDYFKNNYRCIGFDFRGQGQSETTADGYDMDRLTEDIRMALDQLVEGTCHYIGLSMGGFVGMRLAASYPDKVRSLVLLDSSLDGDDRMSRFQYSLLLQIAQWFGIQTVANATMPILFGKKFRKDPANKPVLESWSSALLSSNTKGIFRAVRGVMNREPIAQETTQQITIPVLVLVGEFDKALPLPHSQKIHAHISQSQFEVVPEAGHLASLENPGFVNAAIEDFLNNQK